MYPFYGNLELNSRIVAIRHDSMFQGDAGGVGLLTSVEGMMDVCLALEEKADDGRVPLLSGLRSLRSSLLVKKSQGGRGCPKGPSGLVEMAGLLWSIFGVIWNLPIKCGQHLGLVQTLGSPQAFACRFEAHGLWRSPEGDVHSQACPQEAIYHHQEIVACCTMLCGTMALNH